MYHLRVDIGSSNVLVRMDFISINPLDQSCLSWWTHWILGIGDVCFTVRSLFVHPNPASGLMLDSITLLIHISGPQLQL